MDGNHLCVSAQFEAPGAEQFQPHVREDVKVSKSIACVKALQANHGVGHALLTQPVVASLELLQ